MIYDIINYFLKNVPISSIGGRISKINIFKSVLISLVVAGLSVCFQLS